MVRATFLPVFVPLFLCLSLAPSPALAQGEGAPRGPAAPSSPESPGQERALRRFRSVLERYSTTTSTRRMVWAMKVLREGYPESRQALVEAVRKGSPRARAFAVKVLAEKEGADLDGDLVRTALRDRSPAVRLVAVRAARNLGEDGYRALVDYLPKETDPKNRLAAIDLLVEEWRNADSIPLLVDLLEREDSEAPRRSCVAALESLSGRRYGADLGAWKLYLRECELRRQALELLPILWRSKKATS